MKIIYILAMMPLILVLGFSLEWIELLAAIVLTLLTGLFAWGIVSIINDLFGL